MHLLTRRDAVVFPGDCPEPPPSGWPGCQVQNLFYTYDPAGNITHIRDDAQQTIYFRNSRVEPSADYTYDAIYRLIEATGREHLGQAGAPPTPSSYNDKPRVGILFSASDGNAMGRYLQRYVYDAVGNFEEMKHIGSDPANPGWTRAYAYDEPSQLEPGKQSNRLTSTTIGATTEIYSTGGDGYDAHGNMQRMPQLQIMQWDFQDQLQMTQRQAVNADDDEGVQHQGERTWYVYDAGGERVRKVTELATGEVKDERIYLGGFEIYRRHGADPLVRETLHIMDDKQRIALVETRTQGDEPGVPEQLIRYQFGNHLGSASLELDDQAQIISYEEYTPYGSTSYQAVRSQTETPKRYRYTGMERDEESGLEYHSARYYAPWLCRWTAADPIGLGGGMNAYEYSDNSPIMYSDEKGTDTNTETTLDEAFRFVSIINLRDFIVAKKSLGNKYTLKSFLEGVDEKDIPGIIDTLKHYGYEYSWLSTTNTKDAIAAIGRYEKEWLNKNDVSVAQSLGYSNHLQIRETDVEALNKQRREEIDLATRVEGYSYVNSSPLVAGASAEFVSLFTDNPKTITGAAGAGASLSGAAGAWAHTKGQQGSYSPQVVTEIKGSDPGSDPSNVRPDVYTHEIFRIKIKGSNEGSGYRGVDRRIKAVQQMIDRALRHWGGPGPVPTKEALDVGHAGIPHSRLRPGQVTTGKAQIGSENRSIGASIEKAEAKWFRRLSEWLGLNPHDPENPFYTRRPR